MNTRATLVLDFGAAPTGSNEQQFLLDWEKNIDAEGNEKTSFIPPETVFLLVQLPTGASFKDMRASDTGCSFSNLGKVIRCVNEDVEFSKNNPNHSVSYRLSEAVATAEFDGRTPDLSVDVESGMIIASGDLPAVGTLLYKSEFLSFSLTPGSGMLEELEARQIKLGDSDTAQYKVKVVSIDDTVG